MKLLTKELMNKIPTLYSQGGNPDPTVVCKFFQPWGRWTWYVLEGRKEEGGDWLFFGWVSGGYPDDDEYGYFLLSELESTRGPGGLRIERDIHWKPVRLSTVKTGREA